MDVRVTNVNEPPASSTIGDRTLAANVQRLIIDLSYYFSDPDTGDTLTYSARSMNTSVVKVSVSGSDLTINRQAAGATTVIARATDRGGSYVEQTFRVTVEAQVPRVTIARQNASVTEGQDVQFALTASSAPAAALTVKVNVTETGSFLTSTAPSQVTIAGGSTTAQLTLPTTDDSVDEANGSIAATVQSGTGYTVGSPGSATTDVQDNDLPPAPTGLRANGNLDSGNVTLRWNSASGATSYNVRYSEEACDSDGACTPGRWQTRTYTATTTSTVREATLGGLTEETLYRVQVQAVITDTSDWSDFTLVFPTDSPIAHGTEVATAPFHGYQAKNAQGSHEFRYVLCTETIPTGLTYDRSRYEGCSGRVGRYGHMEQ